MDFFKGRWPMLFVCLAWAYFIAPKFTLDQPVVPISSLEAKKGETKALSKFSDIAGVIIFVVVILGFIFNKYVGFPTWFLAFAGVMLMIICGTLTKQEAIKAQEENKKAQEQQIQDQQAQEQANAAAEQQAQASH